MNNAVFGKSMENVRNRIDVKLKVSEKSASLAVSSHLYKSHRIINENCVAVLHKKKEVLLDKPIYVGFSILELSKLHMYKFHYDHIRVKYGDKAKLLMTDTDSLVYEIETEDLYEDMKRNIDLFDTSDYPVGNRYNIPQVNKKVIGKFKDETNGIIINEFVGIRSKMYSFKLDEKIKGEYEKKRAKGV